MPKTLCFDTRPDHFGRSEWAVNSLLRLDADSFSSVPWDWGKNCSYSLFHTKHLFVWKGAKNRLVFLHSFTWAFPFFLLLLKERKKSKDHIRGRVLIKLENVAADVWKMTPNESLWLSRKLLPSIVCRQRFGLTHFSSIYFHPREQIFNDHPWSKRNNSRVNVIDAKFPCFVCCFCCLILIPSCSFHIVWRGVNDPFSECHKELNFPSSQTLTSF